MSEGWSIALTAWTFAPSVVIGVVLLVASYLAAVGPLRTRFPGAQPVSRAQRMWFLLGMGVIAFALTSPLDALSDEYLFSAHMIQHMLLMLVGPPLLIMGTPGWLLRPLLARPRLAAVARLVTNPVLAFALFNAVLLVWHLPALSDAALDNELVHVLEHLLFMSTAVLMWWQVLSPMPELPRLLYPAQILYLFLQGMPMTLLGALLTFAPAPLYPRYVEAERLFAISALTDQEIAGLIMWMPGGMVYLLALSLVFFRWAAKEQT